MKIGYLILLFLLIFYFGYNISLNLAQENQDFLEVKKTISDFLNASLEGKVEQVMQFFSRNYSDIKDGKPVDYAQIRTDVESFIKNFKQVVVDLSITYLEINKFDIRDNKAYVEVEYNINGFDLDSLLERDYRTKKSGTLIKEDGSWKFTQWR